METRNTTANRKPRRHAPIARHKRKCLVCAHPRRADIEAAFLRFESPAQIAAAHGLTDRRPIYRHAHALRLFARRNRPFACPLPVFLEKAARFRPSGDDVVKAIELVGKLHHRLRNLRQPKPVMAYYLIPGTSLLIPLPGYFQSPLSNLEPSDSNRHIVRLKTIVSHSKQKAAAPSNRPEFESSVSAPAIKFPAPPAPVARVTGIRYSPEKERLAS